MAPVLKSGQDVPEGNGPLCKNVVGTYPKGMTPVQKSSRNVPEGDDPYAE
ncbi:hypothetical protein CRG98_048851, partial [Punica granatum]